MAPRSTGLACDLLASSHTERAERAHVCWCGALEAAPRAGSCEESVAPSHEESIGTCLCGGGPLLGASQLEYTSIEKLIFSASSAMRRNSSFSSTGSSSSSSGSNGGGGSGNASDEEVAGSAESRSSPMRCARVRRPSGASATVAFSDESGALSFTRAGSRSRHGSSNDDGEALGVRPLSLEDLSLAAAGGHAIASQGCEACHHLGARDVAAAAATVTMATPPPLSSPLGVTGMGDGSGLRTDLPSPIQPAHPVFPESASLLFPPPRLFAGYAVGRRGRSSWHPVR